MNRLCGCLLYVSLCLCGTAYAQAVNWPSERPPRPLASHDIKFPPYEVRTLPNGLQVVAVLHHEQPAVSMRLLIRAGSASDPKGKLGLARLLASLLDQGTTMESAQELNEQIDFIGGDGDLQAFDMQRIRRRTGHGKPVMRRGDILFLPRLAGGQQHEFGQVEQLGETARERQMSVVNWVKRATQQADASSARKVRFQWTILFGDRLQQVQRSGLILSHFVIPTLALRESRSKAALRACPVRVASYSATSRQAALTSGWIPSDHRFAARTACPGRRPG